MKSQLDSAQGFAINDQQHRSVPLLIVYSVCSAV